MLQEDVELMPTNEALQIGAEMKRLYCQIQKNNVD